MLSWSSCLPLDCIYPEICLEHCNFDTIEVTSSDLVVESSFCSRCLSMVHNHNCVDLHCIVLY